MPRTTWMTRELRSYCLKRRNNVRYLQKIISFSSDGHPGSYQPSDALVRVQRNNQHIQYSHSSRLCCMVTKGSGGGVFHLVFQKYQNHPAGRHSKITGLHKNSCNRSPTATYPHLMSSPHLLTQQSPKSGYSEKDSKIAKINVQAQTQ